MYISWMILETSLPTYPIYVNFVASTLINGALVNLAILRAISVFPEPVGPEINIFFGTIYLRRFSGNNFLLQRFRIAIATAFLALTCPITYLSKYSTIFFGVYSPYAFSFFSKYSRKILRLSLEPVLVLLEKKRLRLRKSITNN